MKRSRSKVYQLPREPMEDRVQPEPDVEQVPKGRLLGKGCRIQDTGGLECADLPKDPQLSVFEKKFLLCAERGDVAAVRTLLEKHKTNPRFNINCRDAVGRTALVVAIENENMELIELLLDNEIKANDALLHAISEEYVEAVEVLLQHEEKIYIPGMPYSWEAVDNEAATFTKDITPLILAAHRDNYEIIKLLLDRGATLPMPHDVRCACDECEKATKEDCLRHSRSRINAYRALSSPSLISLSSTDPILTAFQLSVDLKKLSSAENEFKIEYTELRHTCEAYATALLDHTRTSYELEVMLNFDPEGPAYVPGERMQLERLKLAIYCKQKTFVAHANVQQLLASVWYEGSPGFRKKGPIGQFFEISKIGAMFPVYSCAYMLAPNSRLGQRIKKPFTKFIIHSSSYCFFLFLLILASQRVESLVIHWIGTDAMRQRVIWQDSHERGKVPGIVESAIVLYIFGFVWSEIKQLWDSGLEGYMEDMWNIVDYFTNMLYLCWIGLRMSAWYIVRRELQSGLEAYQPRERWDPYDPMLISEGAFGAANIFSFLKMVHIFSVNPHLGPLQISLGRMVFDIIKFFFIYTLVLFAFGCGMNQLLWYYSDMDKALCYSGPDGSPNPDYQDSCNIWRRFTNLFETSQSLFWASFGLVELENFELTGIKSFTRFWALLLFGSYSVINVVVLLNLLIAMMSNSYQVISSLFWASFGLVDLFNFELTGIQSYTRFWSLLLFGSYSVINIVVLLNLLIAMMSNSYQIISERSDTEWKFARSKLWMSYFEEGSTVPPPFNIFPTPKFFRTMIGCSNKPLSMSIKVKEDMERDSRHRAVMRCLVRRYVTTQQRRAEEKVVTEDDVNEVKQSVTSFRSELFDILRNNGMKCTNTVSEALTRKERLRERRLLKDFNIDLVETFVDVLSRQKEAPTKMSFIRRGTMTKRDQARRNWNAIVDAAKAHQNQIGTSDSVLTGSLDDLREQVFKEQEIKKPRKRGAKRFASLARRAREMDRSIISQNSEVQYTVLENCNSAYGSSVSVIQEDEEEGKTSRSGSVPLENQNVKLMSNISEEKKDCGKVEASDENSVEMDNIKTRNLTADKPHEKETSNKSITSNNDAIKTSSVTAAELPNVEYEKRSSLDKDRKSHSVQPPKSFGGGWL